MTVTHVTKAFDRALLIFDLLDRHHYSTSLAFRSIVEAFVGWDFLPGVEGKVVAALGCDLWGAAIVDVGIWDRQYDVSSVFACTGLWVGTFDNCELGSPRVAVRISAVPFLAPRLKIARAEFEVLKSRNSSLCLRHLKSGVIVNTLGRATADNLDAWEVFDDAIFDENLPYFLQAQVERADLAKYLPEFATICGTAHEEPAFRRLGKFTDSDVMHRFSEQVEAHRKVKDQHPGDFV